MILNERSSIIVASAWNYQVCHHSSTWCSIPKKIARLGRARALSVSMLKVSNWAVRTVQILLTRASHLLPDCHACRDAELLQPNVLPCPATDLASQWNALVSHRIAKWIGNNARAPPFPYEC